MPLNLQDDIGILPGQKPPGLGLKDDLGIFGGKPTPKPSSFTDYLKTAGRTALAVPEIAAAEATGMVGWLAGKVAGGVTRAGMTNVLWDIQGDRRQPGERAQEVKETTANMLTYQPQTPEGQQATELLGNLIKYTVMLPSTGASWVAKQAREAGYPNLAYDIEDIGETLNLLMIGGRGTKAKPTPEAKISATVEKGMTKGVAPSVAKQRDFAQREQYFGKAEEAVKDIVGRKETITLTDKEGAPLPKGSVPKTLPQFSEAIDQGKREVFKEYDAMKNKVGEGGAIVPLQSAAAELRAFANAPGMAENPRLASVRQNALEWADNLEQKGGYTVGDAQDVIEGANSRLKAFYKNPDFNSATPAAMEHVVAGQLRKGLDTAIEAETGPGYQALKNKYGAYKSIEQDVAHRRGVDQRRRPYGFFDYGNILAGAEAAKAVLTLSPVSAATGGIIYGIKKFMQRENLPDTHVGRMFRKVQHELDNMPKKTGEPFELDTTLADAYRAADAAARNTKWDIKLPDLDTRSTDQKARVAMREKAMAERGRGPGVERQQPFTKSAIGAPININTLAPGEGIGRYIGGAGLTPKELMASPEKITVQGGMPSTVQPTGAPRTGPTAGMTGQPQAPSSPFVARQQTPQAPPPDLPATRTGTPFAPSEGTQNTALLQEIERRKEAFRFQKLQKTPPFLWTADDKAFLSRYAEGTGKPTGIVGAGHPQGTVREPIKPTTLTEGQTRPTEATAKAKTIVDNIVQGKPLSKSKEPTTMSGHIRAMGGIDRIKEGNRRDIKTEFNEEGLAGVFRDAKNRSGRLDMDEAYAQLHDRGLISEAPDGWKHDDWLLDNLKQEKGRQIDTHLGQAGSIESLVDKQTEQHIMDMERQYGKEATSGSRSEIEKTVESEVSHLSDKEVVRQYRAEVDPDFPIEPDDIPESSKDSTLFGKATPWNLQGGEKAGTVYTPPEVKGGKLFETKPPTVEELRRVKRRKMGKEEE